MAAPASSVTCKIFITVEIRSFIVATSEAG